MFEFPNVLQKFLLALLSLTLLTNFACTRTRIVSIPSDMLILTLNLVLIAGRVWRVNRMNNGRPGKDLAAPIVIIIESGAVYSLSLIIYIVTFATRNNSQIIMLDMVTQLIVSLLHYSDTVQRLIRSSGSGVFLCYRTRWSWDIVGAKWRKIPVRNHHFIHRAAWIIKHVAVESTGGTRGLIFDS